MKKYLILINLMSSMALMATDINVSNVVFNRKTETISFDLHWKNSWKNERNHDAAWVFVKFNALKKGYVHGKLAQTGHELKSNKAKLAISPDQMCIRDSITSYKDADEEITNKQHSK